MMLCVGFLRSDCLWMIRVVNFQSESLRTNKLDIGARPNSEHRNSALIVEIMGQAEITHLFDLEYF